MHTLAIGGCRAGQIVGRSNAYEGDTIVEVAISLIGDAKVREAMRLGPVAVADHWRTVYILRKFTWVIDQKLGPERTWWFWIDVNLGHGDLSLEFWDHIFGNYRPIAQS